MTQHTVYPKKYAHGFCFAVLCCGYTLTDFPISTRLTSLALWQSNDCPSASKATLMNMDKYFTWIHYERLHNHNKAKHNKTVCIFLGIYCTCAALCFECTSPHLIVERPGVGLNQRNHGVPKCLIGIVELKECKTKLKLLHRKSISLRWNSEFDLSTMRHTAYYILEGLAGLD